MLIKSGFWNYYLAFRLKNYAEYANHIYQAFSRDGIIAVAKGNRLWENSGIDQLLKNRKAVMEEWLEKKSKGELALETERQLYIDNILPEHYFDIEKTENGQWKDNFQGFIQQCKYNLMEKHKSFNTFLSYRNSGDSYTCYSVMPVKMYLDDWEYIYCPITLSLLDNGWGILKLSAELRNVEATNFSLSPLKNWYKEIKVWDALYSEGGEPKYKILGGEIGTASVRDIQSVCHKVIHTLFDGFLADKDRFSGFETILLSDTEPEFKNKSRMNGEIQKELFHLANAGTLYSSYSKSEYQTFMAEKDFDFGGIHFIKGSQCRMLIYGDAEAICRRMERDVPDDLNSYMQLSVEKSFDPFIEMALCKKDNEVLIYTASEGKLRELYANMAEYNRNLNYVEQFMFTSPQRGKQLYKLVDEILQESFGDIESKIERLRYVEEYQKTLLKERTNLVFQFAALIFGSVFGLPAIRESFAILHNAIWGSADVFRGAILDAVATGVWGVLLIAIVVWFVRGVWDYRK